MLLRSTLFICGAVVMSLEILASRTLAVEFGDNLPVWGALIGTFIGFLSLGYWLGGILADSRPSRLVLGTLIAVAGAIITAMVPFTRHVTAFVFSIDMGETTSTWLQPLLSSTILHGAPVMLLGAVSPFAVKLAAHDLTRLGKRVGGFYAISSLGSIFGTFLTAFYLLGAYGVRSIITAEGVILVGLGVFLVIIGPLKRKSDKNSHIKVEKLNK